MTDARPAVRVAEVLMARRSEREGTGCWTGGYPGEECDGDMRCRCADEAEDDAAALVIAGLIAPQTGPVS